MESKNWLTLMGFYYLLSGLWPLLHLKSFELITGPKVDKWLVKTVGLMITCSALIFLLPWWQGREPSPEIFLLAVLNAVSLMLIDVIYPLKGRISKIYLADAVVEGFFIAALLLSK